MKPDRRTFLKGVAAGAASVAIPRAAAAKEARKVNWNGLGMLYDATKCIGCMTCMVACKKANNLPPDPSSPEELWDNPLDLSSKTKTVIRRSSGTNPTWLKVQCMHCVEPACVSVCMIQAFHKTKDGVVAWDSTRCVGCRYCQVACPFDVPKFEWNSAVPRIVKCELCRHREGFPDTAGPACCEVCPRHAVIFGRRQDLLAEAHRRIAAEPGRYVDHIYGEHEAGGTQVLCLSAVRFEETSLPRLSDQPAAGLSESIQHGLYKGFIAPVALYGVLAGVMWRNRRVDSKSTPETGDQKRREQE